MATGGLPARELPPPPRGSIQHTMQTLARIAAEQGDPWDDRLAEEGTMNFLANMGVG